MDRRFLSRPEVVNASSDFICIRLMTYESESEARILKSYWRRGADLENTVFTILDPLGRPLLRGSRSPSRMFEGADDLAAYMKQVAAKYPGSRGANSLDLPLVDTVRLGLNVAACEHRPLAIVVGESEYVRSILARRISKAAWSESLSGKLVYAASSKQSLKNVSGANIPIRGYLLVAPDNFGTSGRVMAVLGTDANSEQFAQKAGSIVASYRPTILERRDHVVTGQRNGVHWKTAIPVTDKKSLQASRHPIGRGPGGR